MTDQRAETARVRIPACAYCEVARQNGAECPRHQSDDEGPRRPTALRNEPRDFAEEARSFVDKTFGGSGPDGPRMSMITYLASRFAEVANVARADEHEHQRRAGRHEGGAMKDMVINREQREVERLRAELAYAHERLKGIVDLIDGDPEANDPSTDLYVEVHLAKAVVYPAEPTPSERPDTEEG